MQCVMVRKLGRPAAGLWKARAEQADARLASCQKGNENVGPHNQLLAVQGEPNAVGLGVFAVVDLTAKRRVVA